MARQQPGPQAGVGVYPRAAAGADRLIVKTTAEAHRIPTVAENVAAPQYPDGDTGLYREARSLVAAVLDFDEAVGPGLARAFTRGYLDGFDCSHPDNAGRSRSYIAPDGRLEWAQAGSMPVPFPPGKARPPHMTSSQLLSALTRVQRRYDAQTVTGVPATPGLNQPSFAAATVTDER
ncbi:MAG: hypothetical protein ACM30G_17530 [Micromonosporaceae bacterium]